MFPIFTKPNDDDDDDDDDRLNMFDQSVTPSIRSSS